MRDGATDREALRFSVVIPTYQRKEVVLTSVHALAQQEEAPPFEVIVVVDGSTDGSAAALRALDLPFPLSVVEQPNEGRPAACNRGATVARGDCLLFLDDDMEAHPRLLAEHDRSHREGADVVFGHIPVHPDSPDTFLTRGVGEWAERRLRELDRRNGALEIGDFQTGQASIARDLFLGIGGFDPFFTRPYGGEDLDLGQRLVEAGYALAFNRNAISWQRYVITPRQYLRQWRHFGRGAVLLARKHPDRIDEIFHDRRRERTSDRVVLRWLRRPLSTFVLLLLAAGLETSFTVRLFYRVRKLEYFKGVRGAGGIPGPHPVRVLCYHSISDLRGVRRLEPYGVPPEAFRRQLRLLSRRFRFIDSAEFRRLLSGGGVPRRSIFLTFDDCYQDLLDEAVPILRELHVPAAAFAVTSLVGGTNVWDARHGRSMPLLDREGLHELVRSRVSIGSHTRTHGSLKDKEPDELADELRGSAGDLEALGLGRPDFLAYPYGENDDAARRAAAAAGYAGAFTTRPGLVRPGGDPLAIPRIEILRRDTGLRFLWKVLRAGG